MAWSRTEAKERILAAYEASAGVQIKPLERERDLWALPLAEAREIHGVHLYADVANFGVLLRRAREDREKLLRLLRHLYVYQRQVERLIREHFPGAVRVHFQGSRLHAVVFKPYDSSDVASPDVRRLAEPVNVNETAFD